MKYTVVFGRTYLWHALSYTHFGSNELQFGFMVKRVSSKHYSKCVSCAAICLCVYFAVM